MEAVPKKHPVHKTDKPAKAHAVKKPRAAKAPAHKPAHKVEKAEKTEKAEKRTDEAVIETEADAKPVVAKIPHGKSFYSVGRRKTAVSQALLTAGNGTYTINKIGFEAYFQTEDLQQIVTQPFRALGLEKQMNIKAKVHGGGIHAQAESLRHAIARGLIQHNPESRRTLKKLGFLKRDPRVKERKKPGLKRARRAPQFSKR
jgi:small subunit ribosomal protein S9